MTCRVRTTLAAPHSLFIVRSGCTTLSARSFLKANNTLKHIFLGCLLLLLLAGLATKMTEPDVGNELPVIYWVIDPAPARTEQIALFHTWQIRKGHGKTLILKTMDDVERFRRRKWSPAMIEVLKQANPEGALVWEEQLSAARLPLTLRVPAVEMRLDSANNALEKKLIQGLSGVGPDVIDTYNGGSQMQYLGASGMLAELNEPAPRLGFDPAQTYPALRPALFVDGQQMAFPRNVAQVLCWINKETFSKYHQPLPPSSWTFDEFEKRGKAFVQAANKGRKRQTVFFANRADHVVMRRSLGLSAFNETLTRCTLDDPRNVRVMKLIYKWTYEDHLLPSAADRSSFAAEGGWGGLDFQLFNNGQFGIFLSGRWALMQFRKFGRMQLAVTQQPHGGFPNTVLSGGFCTVYKGSKNKNLALLFLGYLASEEYNTQIVRDGDALPPNPKYTQTDAFLRPKDYPNEWGCHQVFAEAASTIAVAQSFSPFILPETVNRLNSQGLSEFMSDRSSAEAAAKKAAQRINHEMQLTLKDSPRLSAKFKALGAKQEQIERLRKAGEKIPAELILNPFHLSYYARQGLLKE